MILPTLLALPIWFADPCTCVETLPTPSWWIGNADPIERSLDTAGENARLTLQLGSARAQIDRLEQRIAELEAP